MGRGDKRTEKGKRFKRSHGNTRPKGGKKVKKGTKPAAAVVAAPAKKTATKK